MIGEIKMSWFDILKIKFKPVDRDRPSPNIKVAPSMTGEVGSYNSQTGETVISANPDVTPEQLADTLAHESTHEVQFGTEPILREIINNSANSIIALLYAAKATPIEDLNDEVVNDLLSDVEINIGNSIKLFLEQEFTIEIQAYSLERNFETREDRNRFAGHIIDHFERRILMSMMTIGLEEEKVEILMRGLIETIEPILLRIFRTFVIKRDRQ